MRLFIRLTLLSCFPFVASAASLHGHLVCRSATKTYRIVRGDTPPPDLRAMIEAVGAAVSYVVRMRLVERESEAYPFAKAVAYFAGPANRVALIEATSKRAIRGRIWDEPVICERLELAAR